MKSRCGSDALGVGVESVVTCMAGFAAIVVAESVVTSLAGIAGARFPQPPGERIEMPAALRYAAAVSRRIRVVCWIRRRDQPNWPSAMTWFFFSSLKTLLTFTEAYPPPDSMSRSAVSIGRFSGDHHWPVLGDRRGNSACLTGLPGRRREVRYDLGRRRHAVRQVAALVGHPEIGADISVTDAATT
jgi:hypothetical protein